MIMVKIRPPMDHIKKSIRLILSLHFWGIVPHLLKGWMS
jgi:hypothetical protein